MKRCLLTIHGSSSWKVSPFPTLATLHGDLRLGEVHFHWNCEAQYRSTLLSSCCIKFYNCMKSGAGAIKVLGKRSGKHNPNPQSWEQFVQLRLRSWANGQARQDPPLANYCFHSQSAFAAQLVSSTPPLPSDRAYLLPLASDIQSMLAAGNKK